MLPMSSENVVEVSQVLVIRASLVDGIQVCIGLDQVGGGFKLLRLQWHDLKKKNRNPTGNLL